MFGARFMLPDGGILMNNVIMWFDPEPTEFHWAKQALPVQYGTHID